MRPTDLTIAIATYNGERFVAQAVGSALATGAHVVVSDDGSTDGTREILDRFSPRAEVILQKQNQGIARQYQFLLDACRTPLALLLNQDDLVLPGRLRRIPVQNDHVTVMNGWIIDGDDKKERLIYRRPPYHAVRRGVFKGLMVENFAMSPSQVIFPPDRAQAVGGFLIDNDLGQGAEDWMCWLRLAADGLPFRLHLRPAMCYRMHDANYSLHGDSHMASRQTVRGRFPTISVPDRRLRVLL
jgi:glycosyltransferase involved in cell wall biosynthesis